MECLAIQPPVAVLCGKNGLDFRPEDQIVAGLPVEERLLAKRIPGEEQLLLPFVPDRQGEHAVELLHAALALLLIQVDNDLGIAPRGEDVAARLQLSAQLPVVVDLTVEDDPAGAVLVGERLMAGLDVDDAQPSAGKPYWAVEKEAFVVRASMGDGPSHRLELTPAHTLGAVFAADATHETSPEILDCRCAPSYRLTAVTEYL